MRPRPSRVPPLRRVELVALVAIVVLYFVHVGLVAARFQDDAFVSFRYAKNLVLGHGLVWNPGERVEGYTNFLWTMLMAIPFAVAKSADPVPFARALGTFAGGATVVLAYALARVLAPRARVAAFVAPLLVAGSWAFAVNSVTGLETSFFAMLVTLGTLLFALERERGRPLGASFVYALAALTRPEGIGLFLVVIAVAFALAPRGAKPPVAKGSRYAGLGLGSLAVFAAIVGAHLAFRLGYYGALVPNTFVAKVGAAATPLVPSRARYLSAFVSRAADLYGIFSALALVFAVRRARDPVAAPVLAGLAFGLASLAVSGGDFMIGYRFLVPYQPLLAVAAVAGAAELADRWRARWGGRALELELGLALIGAAAAGTWIRHSARVVRPFEEIRQRVARDANRAVGEELGATLPPGSLVVTLDIGEIGFRSGLPVLDLSGLTDPAIARRPGDVFDRRIEADDVFGRSPAALVLITRRPGPWDPRREPNPYFPATSTATLLADPRMGDFAYEGRYPEYDELDGVAVTHVLEVWVRRSLLSR